MAHNFANIYKAL